jgi:superfamily II DNA or RNA helicase
MSVISDQVLKRSFGRGAIERGRASLGRVMRASLQDDGSIIGLTRGSGGEVYEQTIESSTAGRINGKCTCPVGWNCKHCVAVLLRVGRLPSGGDRVVPLFGESDCDGPPIALNSPALDPGMRQWLRTLKETVTPKAKADASIPTQTILFLLSEQTPGYQTRKLYVNVVTVRNLKAGGFGVPKPYKIYQAFAGQFAEFISPDEAVLLTLLYRSCKRLGYSDSVFEIGGIESDRVLGLLLDTGKCHWNEPAGVVLKRGDDRKLGFRWVTNDAGRQVLVHYTEPGGRVLRTTPVRYVDPPTGEIGTLDSGLSAESTAALLEAPEVKPETADTVRQALIRSFPDRPDLWPAEVEPPKTLHVKPVPVLAMLEQYAFQLPATTSASSVTRRFPTFRLLFEYGDKRVGFEDPRTKVPAEGSEETGYYARDTHFEVDADRRIQQLGLTKVNAGSSRIRFNGDPERNYLPPIGSSFDTDFVRQAAAFDFILKTGPILEHEGWILDVGPDLQLYAGTPDFSIDIAENSIDWFSMSLGFEIEGQRVDLLPILVSAIRTLDWDGVLDPDRGLDASKTIYHKLDDGRFVALPVERIAPLVRTIYEWYGRDEKLEVSLKVDRSRLGELAALEAVTGGMRWEGAEQLRDLGRRLADVEGIPPAPAPKKLKATLRPYQEQGLAWLQLLREFGFGAILADDMGLGKTIQTIAHILVEKEAGRLREPALIVAPTSTLPNWLAELAQFAPSLKVVYAQGSDRKKVLGSLKKADVVLTTYPLLARDKEELNRTGYHLLVLDEAQYIKNSKTTSWQAAREIRASHRICLTGTPMENHLGELWSLFEFLMPGFLGGSEQFKRRYRTPIETHRNEAARERLARIVRPFLLRRTKAAVAKELPPKTEVLERVDLVGPQRDLYESLRLAMSKRVRDEIASKGLARSQIIVLDALLKLRQACCDPRLVKAESAREVEGSAKLDRLVELLEELREEGRQTLVFSQFTTMLALISARLNEIGIEFVTITGDTKDRATPVKRFQAGEVPVFLISLKAGGTGLNLTAAETVIHYDPWWNPAVERQATDRAHRIGQTKPVFVHKLVATDTVEERILELQSRKADLANALLEGSENKKVALAAEDIDMFFGA